MSNALWENFFEHYQYVLFGWSMNVLWQIKKAFVKSVLPVGNIKSEEFKNSSLFIIDDKLKFTNYRLFLRLFNASALFDITIPTA